MTEAELNAEIQSLVTSMGLWGYRVYDSRKTSNRGFPDWFIMGYHGVIFRECKGPSGELSPDQRIVGYKMRANGLDWDVWRPRDYPQRIRLELENIK